MMLSFRIPPPVEVPIPEVVFPLTVTFVNVIVPPFSIPPPKATWALAQFPLTVTFVSVTSPTL